MQEFDDPVTLDAVNDVELLTGSLSQKLWLKIDILERVAPMAPNRGAADSAVSAGR